MNSATSTDRRGDATPDPGLQPRHLFLLLSMAGATVAVVVTGRAHPVALVLLSATVVAAGLVGMALHGALTGFFGLSTPDATPRAPRATEALEREKMLVLRSIRELEFDRAMGKIEVADYENIGARLRARAVSLMQQIETETETKADAEGRPSPAAGPAAATAPVCGACRTANDPDARFCKSCGGRL